MSKKPNPNREKAFEIYREHSAAITAKEISMQLGETVRNITFWKAADKWAERYNPKGGAPTGNQNAVGNTGGPPLGNQNARTYGWYSKHFPIESRNLIKEAEESGGSALDILWAQIQTQWIAIIRAQKIMHVKDQDDMTKELKSESTSQHGGSESFEIQYAWDKHAAFLNAQSRAMTTLTNMLVKYNDMLSADPAAASEEQRLRLKLLQAQIANQEGNPDSAPQQVVFGSPPPQKINDEDTVNAWNKGIDGS